MPPLLQTPTKQDLSLAWEVQHRASDQTLQPGATMRQGAFHFQKNMTWGDAHHMVRGPVGIRDK